MSILKIIVNIKQIRGYRSIQNLNNLNILKPGFFCKGNASVNLLGGMRVRVHNYLATISVQNYYVTK